MVARSDAENYGRLMVYRFPKDRLVYGPKQIVARINQDTEISRQISLWDQRGSQVIQGAPAGYTYRKFPDICSAAVSSGRIRARYLN